MTDYFSLAIGGQDTPQPEQVDYFGDITGTAAKRQAPVPTSEHETLPSVYSQFPRELENPGGMAGTLGASDAQLADIMQKSLGDKFLSRENTPDGYTILTTRGADGKEQRGYVNRPGLDTEDVVRGVRGSLPYLLAGGAAGAAARGAGTGINMLAQGLASGGTSVAGDVAQMGLGSEQGIETGKAGLMAGFGAAGPVLGKVAGALWRKFVTIPGLVDKETGTLTARGRAAAKQAGIDPSELTPDFARSFARATAETGNPAVAATRAGTNHFRIPATQGQITKDPYLLTQEEGMRRRLYGETAQDTMRAFDERQAAAISEAALGPGPLPSVVKPGPIIAEIINPGRQAGASESERLASTLGESAQSGLREAQAGAKRELSDAWSGTKDLAATPQALSTLQDTISKALSGEARFTPTGQSMAEMIGEFSTGNQIVKEAGGVKLNPVQSVDAMRRNLGNMMKGAQGEDRRQAGMIYDAFNKWIGESADKALLSGDPAMAMKAVKARGFTQEVKGLFEPKDATGKMLPAARRIAKALEQADSGEAVINALVGSQGSRGISDGTAQALKNVKTALQRWAPNSGEQAWNDIRLAYWTRLVTSKSGDVTGAQAIVTNIKTALRNQRSVVDALYSPEEVRQIHRFMMAVQRVAYKPPNASGSGYTAASFIKDGLLKILDSFGLGKPAVAALNYTGIGNAWNGAAARRAVSQISRPVSPNITPAITGIGQAYERSSRSSQ